MRFPHCRASFAAAWLVLTSLAAPAAPPKVILISLDGAKPDLFETYMTTGVINPNTGVGLLKAKGIVAAQNITVTPSLTAVSHIAIATGSTSANNDIPGNIFHAVAQPAHATISGLGAPIGGYQITPLAPS